MPDRPLFTGTRPVPAVLRLGRLRNPGTGLPSDAEDILLTYARLVGLDPRGPTVYPDIARAIEQPEPQTVRFTLRERQRFHVASDGTQQPMSADAVHADFDRHAAEGHTLFTEVIDRVDRPDSRTLVVRLRAPFGLLFELLAAPGASVRGAGMYAGTTARVGSGTWVPVHSDPVRTVYTANAALTGDEAPLLKGIEIAAANVPSELDAAFQRRELDVHVSPVGVAPAQEPGVVVQSRPARRMRGLGLSLLPVKNGVPVHHVVAFQDARVRRAIAMALDQSALLSVDQAYLSGPVGPAHPGDALPEDELRAHPLYRQDPAEGYRLLAAAGVTGLAFRLSLPDVPLMLRLGQMVADAVQVIGCMPRLQTLPFEGWQRNFLAGDFEATLFDLGALDTPDIGLRLHTTEGISGRTSLWGYSNPTYDLAVRQALSAFDPQTRAERSREAQRLLLDDGPAMLPLGASPEYASLAAGVAGYQFDAYELNTGYLSTGWSTPQRA